MEGKQFTKLDLSQAYQQILLDEESKKLLVINTHQGLFRYNRLPFGVSSAPGIFQRTMETILKGIPHVTVYLDDILIMGKTEAEHLQTLEIVLQTIKSAGLRLQKDKCAFLAPSVQYLGYQIDQYGLHPTKEKIGIIQNAPTHRNIAELRPYLGLVNYYMKFIPHLSSTLSPLYSLLCKSTKWSWSVKEEKAFETSKEQLTSSKVLIHYNPAWPLILACDASPYGLGAILSHQLPDVTEKPITFASRTLLLSNSMHKLKKGLSCVYGVKRFHQYLYVRFFTLVTDHKPLFGLLDEKEIYQHKHL